jgi:hypothetical protein
VPELLYFLHGVVLLHVVNGFTIADPTTAKAGRRASPPARIPAEATIAAVINAGRKNVIRISSLLNQAPGQKRTRLVAKSVPAATGRV